MTVEVGWAIEHPDLLVGLVEAEGLQVGTADEVLVEVMEQEIARACAGGAPAEAARAAIRDLLRHGGFKPTGRSKPASEYLARAATGEGFPRINNVVDINNLLSLRTGWPMSLIDLELACPGGEALELRFGQPGESYVFNKAGQAIDVAGLICLARRGGPPLANPVKDSLAAKTVPETRRALAVIYTSRRVATVEEVGSIAEEFGRLLQRHAGARVLSLRVLPEEGAGRGEPAGKARPAT